MTWTSSRWARCLGWTMVLALVYLLSWWLTGALGLEQYPWFLVLPVITDVVIALRLDAWWWVWGPIAISVGFVVLLYTVMVVWGAVSEEPERYIGPFYIG